MKATRSREAGSCEILRAKRSNIFAHRVAPITEQGRPVCLPASGAPSAGAFRRNSANGGAEREDAGPLHCSPMAHNGLRPAWCRSRPPQLFILY